jgi:hypothetical protein
MKFRILFKLLALILPPAGVVLMIVGYSSYSHARSLLHNGVPARGVVTGYETTISTSTDGNASDRSVTRYQARIRFQTGAGVPVEFLAAGARSPEYALNAMVPVVYNPQNPSDAMLQTDLAEASTLGSVIPGGIVLFLGALAFVMLISVNKRLAWLRQNGRHVGADFVRVDRSSGEDRELYYVVCQWVNPETNQTHQFTSYALFSDPSTALAGKKIEVLMDPAKPKLYFVDLAPALERRSA